MIHLVLPVNSYILEFMFELLTGIILRTFPSNRVCIFTRHLGKIFCVTKGIKSPLVAGSTIVFHLTPKTKDRFVIDYLESVSYPLIGLPIELAWLHHLLELYYFFLPEHQANPRDFDFFARYVAMTNHGGEKNKMGPLQELAVSHFLVQTGFYEQPILHHCAKIFEEVIDPSINPGVPSSVISSKERSTRDLILRCLQEHPQFNQFKTIPFLYGAHT